MLHGDFGNLVDSLADLSGIKDPSCPIKDRLDEHLILLLAVSFKNVLQQGRYLIVKASNNRKGILESGILF